MAMTLTNFPCLTWNFLAFAFVFVSHLFSLQLDDWPSEKNNKYYYFQQFLFVPLDQPVTKDQMPSTKFFCLLFVVVLIWKRRDILASSLFKLQQKQKCKHRNLVFVRWFLTPADATKETSYKYWFIRNASEILSNFNKKGGNSVFFWEYLCML